MITTNYERRKPRKYRTGEIFVYQGKEFPLEVIYDKTAPKRRVSLTNGKLKVTVNKRSIEMRKALIKSWYVEQAKYLFFKKVHYYNKRIGMPIHWIRIKEQKSRWGSCSSLGNLNFNWKLVIAPIEILEYVVVHEMCHYKHMDHSKEFWSEVEKILPDYKVRKKWLQVNGQYLDIE